jgi:DUF2934 family protein
MAAQELKGGQATPALKGTPISGSKTEGQTTLSAEQLNQMIAVAAYYRAEQRGFTAGGELEDWLTAEQEVKVLLEGVPAARAPTVMSKPAATSAAAPAKGAEQKARMPV